ncbi:MAG: hypothetical protein KBH23_07905 [Bacteroidaceae bacterium]|nr:hypothetical protein [Bacteroidaceae bacterium]
MNRKYRKSTIITIVLSLYVTVMCFFIAPRNQDISLFEKITVGIVSYAAVILLCLLLRKKEKAQAANKNQKPEK